MLRTSEARPHERRPRAAEPPGADERRQRPVPVRRVQPGETLDRISARYYGDSTKWRLLARANGIEDPLAVRAGSLLSVPRQDAL